MQITFDGQQIVIQFESTPPLQELTAVRTLPFRRFEPKLNAWLVEHNVENVHAMRAAGLPLDGIPPTAQNGAHVDATQKTIMLRTAPTNEDIAKCRGIPDTKTWSQTSGYWHVKPTRRNVEYIKMTWPDIEWLPAAVELVGKTEAPHVESKSKLEELKQKALLDYKFHTKPFDHQLAAFALSRDATSYALFMEPGTGKTKATLDNAAYLFLAGKVDALAVVCPKSIKRNWANEVNVHLPPWIDREVLVWESGKTKTQQIFDIALAPGKRRLAVFIMNIDALVTAKGLEAMQAFLASTNAMMVVDESTRIKNTSAKRTKACVKLGKLAKYRRVLTGTPVTQGPLDVFAQFQFLDSNILGFGSYYSFRNRFSVMGGYQGRQIVKYTNLDELQALVAPYSYRVTKAECLDLPEKVYRKISVDLTAQQRRIYQALQDNMEYELPNGGVVTATIALTLILRFQQIAGGFVPVMHLNDDGDPLNVGMAAQPIDGGNPKLEAMLDYLEDITSKVIIWAHFKPEIEIISRSLREKYGEGSVVEFHGGVNEQGRHEAIARFQGWPETPHDPECRFFVGQTETGGIGLTLTRAHEVIYYSNGCSLESRLQSEDRAHRIGQTNHVTYTDIVASKTVDDKLIYPSLRKKLNLANVITGDKLKEWL